MKVILFICMLFSSFCVTAARLTVYNELDEGGTEVEINDKPIPRGMSHRTVQDGFQLSLSHSTALTVLFENQSCCVLRAIINIPNGWWVTVLSGNQKVSLCVMNQHLLGPMSPELLINKVGLSTEVSVASHKICMPGNRVHIKPSAYWSKYRVQSTH